MNKLWTRVSDQKYVVDASDLEANKQYVMDDGFKAVKLPDRDITVQMRQFDALRGEEGEIVSWRTIYQNVEYLIFND